MTKDFDTEALASIGGDNIGWGSLKFMRALYESSGKCIECEVMGCEVNGKTFK